MSENSPNGISSAQYMHILESEFGLIKTMDISPSLMEMTANETFFIVPRPKSLPSDVARLRALEIFVTNQADTVIFLDKWPEIYENLFPQ